MDIQKSSKLISFVKRIKYMLLYSISEHTNLENKKNCKNYSFSLSLSLCLCWSLNILLVTVGSFFLHFFPNKNIPSTDFIL